MKRESEKLQTIRKNFHMSLILLLEIGWEIKISKFNVMNSLNELCSLDNNPVDENAILLKLTTLYVL